MDNVIMGCLLVLIIVMGTAFWFSPKGCRWLSVHFFARAIQLETGRKAYHTMIEENKDRM